MADIDDVMDKLDDLDDKISNLEFHYDLICGYCGGTGDTAAGAGTCAVCGGDGEIRKGKLIQ